MQVGVGEKEAHEELPFVLVPRQGRWFESATQISSINPKSTFFLAVRTSSAYFGAGGLFFLIFAA